MNAHQGLNSSHKGTNILVPELMLSYPVGGHSCLLRLTVHRTTMQIWVIKIYRFLIITTAIFSSYVQRLWSHELVSWWFSNHGNPPWLCIWVLSLVLSIHAYLQPNFSRINITNLKFYYHCVQQQLPLLFFITNSYLMYVHLSYSKIHKLYI